MQNPWPVMLVTGKSTTSPAGGREMLGRLNRGILQELFGELLVVMELQKPEQGGQSLTSALRGHIDGLTPAVIAAALDEIREKQVGLVFLDGSNLGALAAAIKAETPGVSVCTFFHNVEARFFWGSLKQRRSPRALAVLAANYLAERKAVRHSDTLITLTARDSRKLKRLYGRAATHISAMAIDEPVATSGIAAGKGPPYALFVGGTFYANRAGIAWFAEHVAPRIGMKTCVVGHGFEAYRQGLESPGRVEVIGGVDDLRQWYRGAQVVIAPIFDGSGMKTKVAEALMYGKKIVGTPEAFAGYEAVAAQAGWQCRTADEFVAALAEAEALDLPVFDPALRALFDAQFSRDAARTRMAAILGLPVMERAVP
ncbi:MAG: glycosyltransferase [Aurantimonas endophytica]|uniref:glycosyltransferase n=1 Tax=Aurantimonas endophytica TaxID=1522175 RepID=UPI00300269DC